MRRDSGAVLVALVFTALVSSASGQIGPQPIQAKLGVSGPGCSPDPDTRQAPRIQAYTAEFKTTSIQTLGNGVTILRESSEVRAVDSQQRTLTTRTEATQADQASFTWGHVNDPVDNTQISWNSQTRQVQVIKLPSEADRHGCWRSDSGRMSMSFGPLHPEEAPHPKSETVTARPVSRRNVPEPKTEDLGTITIQGVEAHGQRWTMVTPVGQIGNDKELVTVNETWAAVNLGINMRQINDSPQSGRTTTEVVRLDLSEPPLSTFQPPEGYEVVTEGLHQVPCEGYGMSGMAMGVIGSVH